MAGPWTISRDRQDADAGTDLRGTFSRAGTRSWRALASGLASSATLVRPAARNTATVVRARWAVCMLSVMVMLIAALAWATVSLAQRGITASQAAANRASGPLVIPAPKSAGALPRRFGPIPDANAAAIISELRHRFGAVGYGLVSAARKAAEGAGQPGQAGPMAGQDARAPGVITANWTSGLYGQPGHLDPQTDKPAWVMYLGLDATAKLGAPGNTIGNLMMGILGPYSKIGPWQVNSGHRGGASNCTVAWLAQTTVGVCGWASGHSIGVIASPLRDTSVEALATMLIRMRYDLQRK